MQVNDRDMQVLEKIVKYCEEIEQITMTKTKRHLKRLLAMLLVVVTLVQWVPANVFSVETKSNDYIPGDVNGDGLVNALDINLVRRHIATDSM